MSEKILADRYRLLEQIGVGGMAIVYRAIDQRTGHSVAVKLLRPDLASNAEYVTRFQREAEAAAKMTHHNIVNLLDVGMDGENRYLVMEYVQGRTLKQVIQEKGRIAPATAVQITIRILSALQHAHQNGIIHRDIKPQNILVNEEGHIKVSDFGIARMADSTTISHGDIVMGSVHYFSPEQASGQTADARSDIYSVGVVLYEMLTGRVPFDGETQVAIAMQHIHAQPKPIESLAPEVPAAIAHVCMVAMAKDPNYRYQTAREMAGELRLAVEGREEEMASRLVPPAGTGAVPARAAAQEGAQGRSQTGGRRPAKPKRKINVLWWTVTALIAVMVLAGIGWGSLRIYERVMNTATVPDFVGRDIAEAERLAGQEGLRISKVEANHPTVAAGRVILQAPEVGTTVRKNDIVALTVSKGPAMQVVPTLVGLPLSDAITLAQTANLNLVVTERVVSVDVQADFIIMQSPAAGETCQAGDIVNVTVSGGVAVMPQTVGMRLAQAQEVLTAEGFAVSPAISFVTTEDTTLHDTVATQSVEAGSSQIRGTSVALTVYQVPGMMRSAEVTLDLPESTSLISVRVTLADEAGEVTVFQSEYPADAMRHPVVTLTSRNAGTYTYRVYINGDYKYQNQVTLE